MRHFLSVCLLAILPMVASAYDALIDSIYYDFDQSTKKATVTSGKDKYSGPVNIPSSVNYNGEDYSVTSIGNSAFDYCTALTSITLPNSVKYIGPSAFRVCSNLTSITIPNSVTNLGGGAFAYCSSLTSATLSSSLTNIANSTFDRCSSLASITIPDSVKIIEDFAFEGCSSLASVTIPDCATSLGKYAFYGCSSLTSMSLPNSVTSLGEYSFSGCSGLTSVTIPNSVTSIERCAFRDCTSLTSVTSLIAEPFEIVEEVFYNKGSFTSATLYVPKGTKEKYEATSAWNKFLKIEEIEVPGLKGDVNGDGAVDVADIGAVIDVMAEGTNDPVADVNGDKAVDVADIGTVIDIMAGKDVDTPSAACPDANHPHWIDLGLPSGTKWACCNQGASKPEDSGDYYVFDDALDYNPPSLDQIGEILNNTTSEWTTQNGVNGYKFTGTNGRSVFLPAAGTLGSGMLDYVGMYGDYWSSTYTSDGDSYGYRLTFDSDGARLSYGNCYDRRFVRPVR